MRKSPLSPDESHRILSLVAPLRLTHCPLRPSPRQEAFLRLPDREVFFGGAAGGGKSFALLMAALQYSDVPGYHALLLRRSLSELSLSGGLIDLAEQWLAPSNARWSGETRTEIPRLGSLWCQRSQPQLRLPGRQRRPQSLRGKLLLLPRLRRAHKLPRKPLPADVSRPPPTDRHHIRARTRRDATLARTRPGQGNQQPRRARARMGQRPIRRPGNPPSQRPICPLAPRGQPPSRRGRLPRNAS